MAAALKQRVTKYILIALIMGFFATPLIAFCLFDCKFYASKKIASILLFFFR